jgi:hypothetical protein
VMREIWTEKEIRVVLSLRYYMAIYFYAWEFCLHIG